MSCICGILRFDDEPVHRQDLERMLSSMAHRAPDRRATILDGPIGLGHGLMRVNQEDLFERQPIAGQSRGRLLVADLRIDNREQLAVDLSIDAATLQGMPDSALVMAAYERWGEECPEHLLGDFAFALWDATAGKLILVRDHMGQRGLFFHKGTNFFAFATELRGLAVLAEVPRKLSEAFIACWLISVDEWPVGLTHLDEILALGGGRILTVHRDGTMAERVYWTPGPGPQHEGQDEDYYVATYRAVLEEAVGCRLRRLLKRPALGLSGGFDSAAIAALAGPIMTRLGRKIVTVSAVSPIGDAAQDDARPWIELCARFMPHLDARFVEIRSADGLDDLEAGFMECDGPSGPARHVNKALYATARQAGARLYLDGMGGDYTINHRGYAALPYFLTAGRYRRFFHELRADRRATGRSIVRILINDVVGRLLPAPLVRLLRFMRRGFGGEVLPTMIAPEFRRRIQSESRVPVGKQIDFLAFRTRMRDECIDICRRLPTYRPSPDAAMAAMAGLEFSRPFHDRRVVEFGLAIPEDLYVKSGRNRYLATRALRDLYPPEFQTRDRSQTSGAPGFETWLARSREMLKAEAERLASRSGSPQYLDYVRVRTALKADYSARGSYHLRALNGLLLERFVEWFRGGNG